jgi:hypothetical protein
VLACVGIFTAARAAVSVPPEIALSDAEVQERYMSRQAEESLKEKLKIGKERYEQRKDFRSALLTNLRANANQRREIILGQDTPAAESSVTARNINWAVPVFWLMCSVGCLLLARFVRRTPKGSSAAG